MKITGIICEYNPFHSGHAKQIHTIRTKNSESGIVCLMSGNFVQRGTPAVTDKRYRAESAVRCGADLVLELPVTIALRSAEGFAAGGVGILSTFCSDLCFGAETADTALLMDMAKTLLSDSFSSALREYLDQGLSFPAARQAAIEAMGIDSQILLQPNNILAIEYCKAILCQASGMSPVPILRQGNYHDIIADKENPSATALRELMYHDQTWRSYMPEEAAACFANAAIHTLEAGERAILGKLRTMTDAEYEVLPYGSEGLWRKLMHAARSKATLEEILSATKSKRYTQTRLNRMVMCGFLGISKELLESSPPYVRVLGFNDKGREILKVARQAGQFPNIGETIDHPYQQLENRCGDLYGLFAKNTPQFPGAEKAQRVFYLPQD